MELKALKHRVSWDDNIDVSYITKEAPPCKTWRPTTMYFAVTRMKRKEKFDPVESPKRRAHCKNELFMAGCQCKAYYVNEPVGYSVFSLLGAHSTHADVYLVQSVRIRRIRTFKFGLLPRESPWPTGLT